MDMEAGIEHLTRGTAKAVDKLIIVVEPGRRSIETAQRIFELAKDLNLKKVAVVGNKIQNPLQKDFIVKNLPNVEFLAFIPYDEAIINAGPGKPLHTGFQSTFLIEEMIFQLCLLPIIHQ